MGLISNLFKFGKKLRMVDENSFRQFLDTTVSQDLTCAIGLSFIPYNKRTEVQESLFNYLVKRYIRNQNCVHESYRGIPLTLKREYNVLHRKIMELVSSSSKYKTV